MIAEILITTVITVLLVFIGCLVLGLQISNIKTKLSSQEKAQATTTSNLSSLDTVAKGNIFSLSNEQISMKKILNNHGVDLYNADQGLKKFQYVQQEEIKARSNMGDFQKRLKSDLANVNTWLSNATSGIAPFSALTIGPAKITKDIKGNLLVDTGSNGIFINSSNVNLPIDGSCLGIGMGKLCNTNDKFSFFGSVNTTKDVGIADLRLKSTNGKLNITDSNDIEGSRGIILNGIKQTMPGSMIDYNGFGMGEFGNGIMRTYAPTKPTSQVAMSFRNPDNSFQDVVLVKNGGVDIAGNMKITGKIDNKDVRQAMEQSQAAQQNSARTMQVLSQAIETVRKSQLLNDAALKSVVSANGKGIKVGGDITIDGKINNRGIQQLMQQTQITQQQSARTMQLLGQVIQQLQRANAYAKKV